jgi:D-serine deaminase-like pyridoxal phosphate-dependent protein
VQAGSYTLMDTQYATHGHPFEQACWVIGTVIAVALKHAVADVGLKAMGMDHGNPAVVGGTVWFLSDEHVTFAPDTPMRVGDRVRVTPAHIDPTMAMHEVAWLLRGDEVIDRWPIDLRGW